MSSHHGDEAKDEAAEEIEHPIEILLILHQRWTFVHEGGEGGETATKTRGEQELKVWRQMTAEGERREDTNEETANNVDGESTPGEGHDKPLREPFPYEETQSASKETANGNE